MRHVILLAAAVAIGGWLFAAAQAQEAEKPDFLVIRGDDIGTWNISQNNRGMMGYETPNIDRIAAEGLSFTEKNSNREGAYRVPTFVRRPGRFPAGQTLNGIVAHEDLLPTFAAIAGNPDVTRQLREGVELNGRSYRNHIDGYDQVACMTGAAAESPRSEFWYVNDDGQVVAARYDDLKVVFLENRGEAFGVWREPFIELRAPLLFNLRRDPFEKSRHDANVHDDWFLDRAFAIVPIQSLAAQFLQTMRDYPPSQTPGSFDLGAIEEKLRSGMGD